MEMGIKHEKYVLWRHYSNNISVVMITRNCPGNWELCAIAHEYRQKTWKRRVLAMPLNPCIGGHSRWKSSRLPKNVHYSPWKWRQKTWKTWVLVEPDKPCTGRYDQWKSYREPKVVRYSPWKWEENMKNTCFGDATHMMFMWSWPLEVFWGTKNYAV